MKLLVKYSCVLLSACIFALAVWAKPPVITQIEIHQQLADNESPLGYWNVDLSYPKLSALSQSQDFSKLNIALENLAKQYQCANKGELSFTAKVKFMSEQLLVIDYESEWMCSAMPHPDFTSGIISFGLIDQQPINFEHFKSALLREKLESLVIEKAREGRNALECNHALGFNRIYPEDNKLIFAYVKDQNLEDACEYQVAYSREEVLPYFSELPRWN